MSRLALSDSDKQARDWFVETTKELGCDVKIDEMGTYLSFQVSMTCELMIFRQYICYSSGKV